MRNILTVLIQYCLIAGDHIARLTPLGICLGWVIALISIIQRMEDWHIHLIGIIQIQTAAILMIGMKKQ